MKTTKIKIETEHQKLPRNILLWAVTKGVQNKGLIGPEEEMPIGSHITLEKLGKQPEGFYLCYAHVTLPDSEEEKGDSFFKEFYGLEDEDYLLM